MYDCKPNKTPLVEKLEFDKLDLDEYYDAPCQNLLGCLMYIFNGLYETRLKFYN